MHIKKSKQGCIKEIIICLGGGLNPNGTPSAKMVARLDKAYSLFNKEDYDLIITTSKGTFRDSQKHQVTEAEVGKRYLVDKGIDKESILIEDVSMDTIGNAYFCRVIHLDPRKLYNPTIITNEFHMVLVEYIFGKVLDSNYNPIFINAPNKGIENETLKKWRNHEEEMVAFYNTLFSDVEKGDLKAFHEYIYFHDPAYTEGMDIIHKELTERIERIWE